MKLILGDCLDKLKDIDDNSIDSIVTDPPAGISFMNKAWDKDKGDRDQWIKWLESIMVECLRVLKPGGHALVWALPRTSHWTAFAIENAGFEIRDCIQHVFGSGFPKNMDISENIDNAKGKVRTGGERVWRGGQRSSNSFGGGSGQENGTTELIKYDTPVSEEAKQWDGWGTAIKPANENWWLCRKPISEKRIIDNVLKHGTGGINVDGCRVGLDGEDSPQGSGNRSKSNSGNWGFNDNGGGNITPTKGRWPSNFIMSHDEGCELIGEEISENKPYEYKDKKYDVKGFVAECKPNSPSNYNDQTGGRIYKCVDGCPIKMMDEQSGVLSTHKSNGTKNYSYGSDRFLGKMKSGGVIEKSQGTASRFFPNFTPEYDPFHYFAKASVSERNDGCDENLHPTVKSLSLMRWLITLITPPKGIVLDPFMGSGSTGCAAAQLGFDFIGIEKEPEYFEIAKKRIQHAKNPHGQMGLF